CRRTCCCTCRHARRAGCGLCRTAERLTRGGCKARLHTIQGTTAKTIASGVSDVDAVGQYATCTQGIDGACASWTGSTDSRARNRTTGDCCCQSLAVDTARNGAGWHDLASRVDRVARVRGGVAITSSVTVDDFGVKLVAVAVERFDWKCWAVELSTGAADCTIRVTRKGRTGSTGRQSQRSQRGVAFGVHQRAVFLGEPTGQGTAHAAQCLTANNLRTGTGSGLHSRTGAERSDSATDTWCADSGSGASSLSDTTL